MTDKIIIKSTLIASATEKASGQIDPDQPLTFVVSDERVDRYGDIVRVDGWDLSNFKKNPVALFGHGHQSIVGTWRVWAEKAEKRLMAELRLAAAGTGQVVDYVRALVAQKILKAASVSFLPTAEPKMIRDEKNDRVMGYEYTDQELLEISLVAVGANAGALAVAKSMNISDEMQRSLFAPVHRGMSAARARIELERLRGRGASPK